MSNKFKKSYSRLFGLIFVYIALLGVYHFLINDSFIMFATITLVIFAITYFLIEQIIKKIKELKVVANYSKDLEIKVDKNSQELKDSNDLIKQTQRYLMEIENMASLGRLVAGISHEINTPIGVSVTAASHLDHTCSNFIKKYTSNEVKQSDFEKFIKINKQSTDIILRNLERAANLIRSFKSVSVDQTYGDVRKIKVYEYIESILLTLQPKLKKCKHTININCDKSLYVNIAAGFLSQIVTNLIDNALIHAFENIKEGTINFDIKVENGNLIIIYSDNGKGLDAKTKEKFFEPFFTTKRATGGSGLGTHIINDIVTNSLNGSIKLDSKPDNGLTLILTIPLEDNNDV